MSVHGRFGSPFRSIRRLQRTFSVHRWRKVSESFRSTSSFRRSDAGKMLRNENAVHISKMAMPPSVTLLVSHLAAKRPQRAPKTLHDSARLGLGRLLNPVGQDGYAEQWRNRTARSGITSANANGKRARNPVSSPAELSQSRRNEAGARHNGPVNIGNRGRGIGKRCCLVFFGCQPQRRVTIV